MFENDRSQPVPLFRDEQHEPSKLLTVRELAEYLNVTPKAIYSRIHRGEAPPMIRLGSHSIRFSREDVDQWLKNRKTGE